MVNYAKHNDNRYKLWTITQFHYTLKVRILAIKLNFGNPAVDCAKKKDKKLQARSCTA